MGLFNFLRRKNLVVEPPSMNIKRSHIGTWSSWYELTTCSRNRLPEEVRGLFKAGELQKIKIDRLECGCEERQFLTSHGYDPNNHSHVILRFSKGGDFVGIIKNVPPHSFRV